MTLAMAAHACLTILRAREPDTDKAETDGSSGLVPLSLPELRRLIHRLAHHQPVSVDHVLHWSTWRRRRHQTRSSHDKQRGHTPPEPAQPSGQRPLQY
uniref:hypothetical protein n=1 Tax=Streptomyces sp. CA-141956 TaxID=3240051 RepID=UPI003F496309